MLCEEVKHISHCLHLRQKPIHGFKKGDSCILLLEDHHDHEQMKTELENMAKKVVKVLGEQIMCQVRIIEHLLYASTLQDDMRRWQKIWTPGYYLGGRYSEK